MVAAGGAPARWPAARVRVRAGGLDDERHHHGAADAHGRAEGAPSKSQLDLIRAHPHRAAELLVAAAEWPTDLAAVRDHHERTGAACPRGEVAPGDAAGLVRAADVYAAKISPRALRRRCRRSSPRGSSSRSKAGRRSPRR
ncbi:MAG: hypothetical protein U1F67_06465 [Rubrivivax sp.]